MAPKLTRTRLYDICREYTPQHIIIITSSILYSIHETKPHVIFLSSRIPHEHEPQSSGDTGQINAIA